MTGPGGRRYRGVSGDERRDERRSRLLESCLDVVGESGVAEVTAESIAKRAGLSKRYFYESFADRDAILVAALEKFLGDVWVRITEHLECASDDLGDRMSRTVDALLAQLQSDDRSARLYLEARAHPALSLRLNQGIDDYVRMVSETVLQVRRSPRSRVAATMIVSGTTDVVMRWLDDEIRLSRPQLVRHLAEFSQALAGPLRA